MSGKLFPIKDLWMINSSLETLSKCLYIHSYTQLRTSLALNECLLVHDFQDSCWWCSNCSEELWCVSMTPNNTETIERMTCHCFQLPIRRDLTNSSYSTRVPQNVTDSTLCKRVSRYDCTISSGGSREGRGPATPVSSPPPFIFRPNWRGGTNIWRPGPPILRV